MQELGAQKSPQGIAALAMGNPTPLQQRVQQGGKDPQTGLPKDLVDALALNIVTNEQDAAKRHLAMQQLQQAAGSSGQIPTVVESLQQQAQQKMAALQQAQAQQGGIAQALQQSQQQAPQQAGIDQLPAEFSMAGGGIVSFAGGKLVETPYDPETATRKSDYASTPVYASLPEKLMYEAMQKNPEQEAQNYRERLQKELGAPDLSQHDRLMAELEARKQKLEPPKAGWDAFVEYMGDVAATGRGKKWYEAGAQASAANKQRQLEREQQQYDLTKQGIDVAQKKSDAERGWKEKLFTGYEAELKRVGDSAYNAAIAQGKNEADAEKMRQEAIQKQLDRENNLLMERERGRTTLAAANAPGAKERIAAEIMALRKKGTPEALAEANQKMSIYQSLDSGGVGALRNQRLVLESLKKTQADIIKDVMSTPEEKAAARQAIVDLDAEIKSLGPASSGNPAPPAAIALPPNPTPDTLKDGQVYITNNGNGRWDAAKKKFVAVP